MVFMPILVRKRERGFVDPLSLFALLFLVVSLSAVTYVASNPDIKQLVGSYAREVEDKVVSTTKKATTSTNTPQNNAPSTAANKKSSGETNDEETSSLADVQPLKIVPKTDTETSDTPQATAPTALTCDANGKQYPVGDVVVYGGIGSYATCGSDGKWDIGVGNLTDIKPENVPTYAQETYNTAVAEENGKQEQTVATKVQAIPAAPTQNSTSYGNATCSGTCTPQEACVLIGYGYYGCQSKSTITTIAGQKQCNGSNLETWSGTKWEAVYCSAGCNGSTNKCNTPTASSLANVTGSISAAPIQNTSNTTTSSTLPQYSSMADCQSNTNPNSRAYTACGQYAKPDENNNVLLTALKGISGDFSSPDSYSGCSGKTCNVVKSLADDLLINDQLQKLLAGTSRKSLPNRFPDGYRIQPSDNI